MAIFLLTNKLQTFADNRCNNSNFQPWVIKNYQTPLHCRYVVNQILVIEVIFFALMVAIVLVLLCVCVCVCVCVVCVRIKYL